MPSRIVEVNNDGGAAICAACFGKLDLSWIVRFADGHTENRCSLHIDDDCDTE